MNIRELAEATGQPARNIRFLISEGVVPEPEGRRRGASYGPEHVEALETYAAMKAGGVNSLALIRQAVEERRREAQEVTLEPVPGVTVRIEREAFGAMPARDLARAVAKAVREAAAANGKGDGK